MRRVAGHMAVATALAGIGVQLSFPFFGGGTIALTVASVLLLAATAALHAGSVGGFFFATAVVASVALIGLVAEAVGVATGFPFGEYSYTGTLGPSVLGVSALVLLAWLTLAYPSYVVARRLVGTGGGRRRAARIGVAAVALTAWDVFLDPQMVEAGNWGWANPEPSLPGTGGIPLTNYAGWLLVSAVMALAIESLYERALRRRGTRPLGVRATQRQDAVPYTVYLWTYVSSVIGNLTFWERPAVAVAGGIAMGLVTVPLIVALRSRGTDGDRTRPVERPASGPAEGQAEGPVEGPAGPVERVR